MRKEFWVVCASLFLLVSGTYISGTLLVPYASALGGTSFSIGVVYGAMYIVRLIFGGPIGHLSQRRGTKAILQLSLMLYPFIAAAYVVSWNIPSLLGARILHGFASAMMLPMAMAYIAQVSPAGQEGRYMGIYNTILFAASAIGPVMGGVVYDRYGIKQAFYLLLLLALAALAIMLLAVKAEKGRRDYPPGSINTVRLSGGPGLGILRIRGMVGLSAMNIVQAVTAALLGATFTQLSLSIGMKMNIIGLLIALNNAIIGAVQIPLGKVVDRINKPKITIVSGIGMTLWVVLLPMVQTVWGMALLLVILGLFMAVNLSCVTALSAILGKESGMGFMMGFLGSANSLGTIIGYLALGSITDRLGIRSAFYLTGSLSVLALLLFGIQWRHTSYTRAQSCL